MKRYSKPKFYTKTRDPLNTFTNFWNVEPNQIKKGRNKDVIIITERPMLKQEVTDDAREALPNSRLPNTPSRTKSVKVRVRVPGKRPGTTKWGTRPGKRISNSIADPDKIPYEAEIKEDMEKYKQRLNMDYTKKRKWGRFTKNPRAKRSIAIVEPKPENPISNVHYKTTLITHVRTVLLKDK